MLRSRRPSIRAKGQEMLASPPVPKGFEYLLVMAYKLHGRSGRGGGGLNPLRPTEITAWAAGTGHIVHPHEFDALLDIDLAMLSDIDPFADVA